MKLLTVEHSNSKEFIHFNGAREWKGFVVRAEIEEGEDYFEAKNKLVALIEKSFTTNEIPFEEIPINKPLTGSQSINKPISVETIIQEINNCTAIDQKTN